MSAVEGLLDRAVDGHGAVVGVVGSPGIGKSRLVREVRRWRAGMWRCSPPSASRTPARSPSMPSRGCCARPPASRVLTQEARDRVRDRVPEADPEDLLLLDDLLGIADPDTPLPPIDPDARRRRLTALVNAASLARKTPAVYVVEDAHWIDEVSESMLAEFLTVIPQTPSLVLVTYRPEYEGALARVHGAQTIALAPLSDSETAALVLGAARAGPLSWRAGPERSPTGPPVIRFSPRRSCANWPSAECCAGSRAHTVDRQRLLR